MLKHFSLLFLLLLTGCVASVKGLYPPLPGEPTRNAYIISHGWHTGIAIKIEDIPDGLIPEATHFPDETYLEIGWGDKGFYQAPKITVKLTLQALFVPSSTVMHVVGFKDEPDVMFPASEIIKLRLSEKGFLKMLQAIDASFERDGNAVATPLRAGLYGNSLFYNAKGRYHALHTCNDWTGAMLRKSGFPITTLYATSAGNIIDQTHQRGEVIRMFKRNNLPPNYQKR